MALAASFDSRRAATSIEHAICARQDLSELDSRLGDAYRKALSLQADRGPLLRDQKAWLSNRNAACGALGAGALESCLLERFKDRIATLSSMASQAGAQPPNKADVWANIPTGAPPPKDGSSLRPVSDPAVPVRPDKDAAGQSPVAPEVVRLENITVEDGVRTVYVGNSDKHYVLFCSVKAEACITPEEDKNYFLFNENTRWKMPGAEKFLTLSSMQDFTIKYNQGQNIGLIAEDKSGGIGMFVLDETGGGYERDVIFSDGPIIYGTDMNDADRQKAWKYFFTQMVEAVLRQQGKDALGVKLAKRCLPGRDFCMMNIDANFVGIGGIQEPRKVGLIVATDIHDPNLQLMRMVCTWPAGKKVCRDWNTGKLIPNNDAQ
jgi:uncharacterized protein YecT (DUF1311 family)